MGFFSNLEKRAREVDSLLCIGLDPHLKDLSTADSQSAKEFCLRLIEATADLALAFKPNIDDLREAPAKYIAQKVLQSANDEEIYFVEPKAPRALTAESPLAVLNDGSEE